MEGEGITILNNQINAVVVKLHQRKYPGIIIQGDSLWILYSQALELKNLLENEPDSEIYPVSLELYEKLRSFMIVYEKTLEELDIDRPYNGHVENIES